MNPTQQLIDVIKTKNLERLLKTIRSGIDLSSINVMTILNETSCSIETLRILVKNGIDINAQDENGMSLLMFASSYKNIDLVEYLFKSGANLDLENKNGLRALSFPIVHGDYKLTEYLVMSGADVNYVDIGDFTPLMSALSISEELVNQENKELEESGENVSIIKKLTLDSFLNHVPKTHNKIAKLLIENGANIHYKNQEGESAYQFALKSKNSEMIELLEKLGVKE